MGAEGSALRRLTRSVRSRATVGAVAVVAVALLLASSLLVLFLRRSLTNDVETAASVRAVTLSSVITSDGDLEEQLSNLSDDVFVQVVDQDGGVVASTSNVGDEPLEVGADTPTEIEVPFDDDPFLVVSYTVEVVGPTEIRKVVVGHNLDHVEESTQAVTGLLAVGVPLLLAFVGFVTWRVVGGALTPVESIRSEVQSIATRRLDRRVPVPQTGDEIARLATTMNAMLERLERGSAIQKRFVSDASHELRSPVATIRQHAEVALAHPESTSVPELAEAVLAEDLRVQGLVEDLLVLTRLDEGAGIPASAIDLDDLVFDAVSRRNGSMRVNVDGVSGARVRGDRRALERSVNNLVDNACRHARSEVSISLFEEGDEVVLRVDDDGAGVPPADRTRVFERFVRLDEARDRDSGGSGVGLAIVAEVTTHHGGSVSVSDAPLGGARFEVRLPRAD